MLVLGLLSFQVRDQGVLIGRGGEVGIREDLTVGRLIMKRRRRGEGGGGEGLWGMGCVGFGGVLTGINNNTEHNPTLTRFLSLSFICSVDVIENDGPTIFER